MGLIACLKAVTCNYMGVITIRREKSATRKMFEDARDFFKSQYTNDVTVKNYCLIYKRFLKYCREFYNAKIKDDCQSHIQDYVDYLIENGYTPSTIHTSSAAICSYHNIPLSVIKKPKRITSDYSRGRPDNKRKERNDNDLNNPAYSRLVEFQKRVGIRRSELARLTSGDFLEKDGNFYVSVRRGKGGKRQEELVLPYDVNFVKSYFTNTTTGERIFSKAEMKNHLNLHTLRAQAAKDTYTYLENRLKSEGEEYRKKIEAELREARDKNNINPKTGKTKPFPEERLTGTYFLRGKSKSFAIKNNLPICYDRLLVFYVSVFKLAHYRLGVTVQSYLNILT